MDVVRVFDRCSKEVTVWLLGIVPTEEVPPTLAIEVGAPSPCARLVSAIAKRRDAERYVDSLAGARAFRDSAPTSNPEPCQLDRWLMGISVDRDSATALVGVTNCDESPREEGLS